MLPSLDVEKSCFTDDDEYDQYVSDLSEDESYPDRNGVAKKSKRCSASCNAAIECFHPSMMVPPRGKSAMSTNTEKRVLVLTNVSSMQSLTAGSEKDDAPRIPSRTELSSDATFAVRRRITLTNDTMCNTNWDDIQKPAATSSNLFLSRIQALKHNKKSFITLDRNLCPTKTASAERSSACQRHQQTTSRREPLSQTDLQSASMPTLQYDATEVTDYRNATWTDLPTNPLPIVKKQPFCSSSFMTSLVQSSSNTINLTPTLKKKLLHVPSATSLLNNASSHSADSAPRLPKRTPFKNNS